MGKGRSRSKSRSTGRAKFIGATSLDVPLVFRESFSDFSKRLNRRAGPLLAVQALTLEKFRQQLAPKVVRAARTTVPAKPYGYVSQFKSPDVRAVGECVRRSVRKQVIHASGLAGKRDIYKRPGAGAKGANSSLSCR